MAASDFQAIVVEELREYFAPLLAVADSPSALEELLVQLGWDPAAVSFISSLQTAFQAVDTAASAIDDPPDTLPEVIDLVSAITTLVETVRSLPGQVETFAQTLNPPPAPGAFADDLFRFLTTRYLRRRSPHTYWTLVVLDVIRGPAPRPPSLDSQGYPALMAARGPRLDPEALWSLLSDPIGHLQNAYVPPGGLQTVADARLMSDRLFPRLIPLLGYLGVHADYARWDDATLAADTTILNDTKRAARSLQARIGNPGVGADFAILARDDGGPGLSVTPAGVIAASLVTGQWALSAVLDASLAPLVITENGITVTGTAHARLDASAARLADPATHAAFTIGSRTGTRLEVGLVEVSAFFDTRRGDFGLGFETRDGAVVLRAADGDGFLQKLLPPDGLRAEFAFGVRWSRERGLCVSGAMGIEVEIPLGLSIGGVVDLTSLYLAVRLGMERIGAALGISFGANLGPFAATVTRIGLRADYAWAGQKGFTIGFLPPTGAGLSIDAGLTGGGFIEFDEPNERYAGILALKFGEIGLTAIGLVTTRLPDGSKGFSMLVNIGILFDPPIQLSMGFVLSGVGGLIGVNRTMMIDVLREGVKKRTLDSILFPEPEWVIPNAAKVISDLRAVFPPAEGRFVVGPMVKIGYGTPAFITADIGIFLELPSPVRIVLLGQLAMDLPTPNDSIVYIHLDIVGVLDFEKKELSFQASLYDSGILSFELFGDAAFFLSWGPQPEFAMSLGGFHPRFDPPPPPIVFAGLRRLGLGLSRGSSFQLSCGVYHAVTPNSLQFGARADLYASACGAEVTGFLSFDTLIYFSPFSFEIDMGAGVQIRVAGRSLADIRLDLTLSGPTPWNARGKASIKILFFSITVNFNITWGRDDAARLDPVNPWPRLVEALTRAESWGGLLPSGVAMVESLRALDAEPVADGEGAPVIVHPAGLIEVRQNVAPLETTLERFANAPLLGYDRLRIEAMSTGDGATIELDVVEEFFARGQFERLSKDELLAAPAFERLPGGVTARAWQQLRAYGTVQAEPLAFESIVLHPDRTTETPAPADQTKAKADWAYARHLTAGNAARRSALRGAGTGRFATDDEGITGTIEEKFVVVDAATLTPVSLDARVETWGKPMTHSQARRAMADHVALHPDDETGLAVVAAYEVEEQP